MLAVLNVVRRWHLITYVALTPLTLQAQTVNEQVWLEAIVNYAFAKSYNFENIIQYNTLLDSPRWRSLHYNPQLQRSLGAHFDVMTGVTLVYTNQTEEYNTFEIRPAIGCRVHFTPKRRLLTRLYVRIEQRNVENLDDKSWESTIRPRIRAELLIPINHKSFHDDKLWYGLADAEWFLTIDDVRERFANRFRLRTGIGYRLNYTSRFEFVFMIQESKKAIGDSFYSTDNVFRFRYRHYLRKTPKSR